MYNQLKEFGADSRATYITRSLIGVGTIKIKNNTVIDILEKGLCGQMIK
ncbi:hypothetical protein [Clostridium sp. ZS2-4]|nr:hypothetical protein [Clostridium sp. ZS2-4]MCY6355379.1 hypothetical protein [Clostridium sp. ZS2-4]